MNSKASNRLRVIRNEYVAAQAANAVGGLDQWSRFYEGIADTDDLERLFNERTADGARLLDVNSVEFDALRAVLRERKGLEHLPRHAQAACTQCLAVVCRCGEDWWSRGDR